MTDRPRPEESPAQQDIVVDPTLPPFRRGTWNNAAVTNVRVTDAVKQRMRTVTQPWMK